MFPRSPSEEELLSLESSTSIFDSFPLFPELQRYIDGADLQDNPELQPPSEAQLQQPAVTGDADEVIETGEVQYAAVTAPAEAPVVEAQNPQPASASTTDISHQLNELSTQLQIISYACLNGVTSGQAYSTLLNLLAKVNPREYARIKSEHEERVGTEEDSEEQESGKRQRGDDSESVVTEDKMAERRAKNKRSALVNRANAASNREMICSIMQTLSVSVKDMANDLTPVESPVTSAANADRPAVISRRRKRKSPLSSFSVTTTFTRDDASQQQEKPVQHSHIPGKSFPA